MENFETLSVEEIFLTEMARTALKSSHLSSLVNIKSAFLPVRSGLTKSFAEDQRVLYITHQCDNEKVVPRLY